MKGTRALRGTAMSLAAAILLSNLVAAVGNPACAHHAGEIGSVASTSAHAPGHDAHGPPGNQESDDGHDDHPCNCPAQCQLAGAVSAIRPSYGFLSVPQANSVSLVARQTREPPSTDPAFLHPFANAPPRI